MLKIFIPLFVFFFSGCEDKTFTKIYQKSAIGMQIDSFSISSTDPKFKTLIIAVMNKKGIIFKDGAGYVIKIDSRQYEKHCNNPHASSYESTYDGFVSLQLLKNMKVLYLCQKDYHGILDEGIVSSLIERMQDDMALKFIH